MARELENINESGELNTIKLDDPSADSVLLKKSEIDAGLSTKEDDLGSPTVDGEALVSTITGDRSWISKVGEAPSDNQEYVRKNDAWIINTGGTGVGEAPNDTKQYGRQSETWTEITQGSPGDMLKSEYATGVLQSSHVVDNALFTNGLEVLTSVPAGALFTDTIGIPEAPSDTKQYARQDVAWSEVIIPPQTATTWGTIEGTLFNQIDLDNALYAKAEVSGSDTQVFKVADAILDSQAINKSQLTASLGGKLDDVTAGSNVSINKLNPTNPIISANFSSTAGTQNRLYFTGDEVTLSSGTYLKMLHESKGVTPSKIQILTVPNGTTQSFAMSWIDDPMTVSGFYPKGTYTGDIIISVNANVSGLNYYVDIYLCDSNGTDIKHVVKCESSVTNVEAADLRDLHVSAYLDNPEHYAIGQRFKYVVSVTNHEGGPQSHDYSLYTGSEYDSYFDVPIDITTDTTINKSTVAGTSASDALNALNSAVGTKEDSLSNPAADGQILSSTTTGTRSWIDYNGGIYESVKGFTGTDINAALLANSQIYLPSGAYDISDVAVAVPTGSVMRFEDGAVISGSNTITGNNTVIEAGRSHIFNVALAVSGSWDYDVAYVEWFGAGIASSSTSSNDAAAINKTIAVFDRVTALAATYYLESTINYRRSVHLKFGVSTILRNTSTMYDTMLSVVQQPFFIEGGKWFPLVYSDMTGGTLDDAYVNWIWDWQLEFDNVAPHDRDFREMSYVKDVQMTARTTGSIDVEKSQYLPSGWRIEGALAGDKSYFAHISNVNIGWMDQALYVNGWGGGMDGMVNSWHWSGFTSDNNYKGIVLQSRAAGHKFSGLQLQPKNSGQTSSTMAGSNSGDVFTLTITTDKSFLYKDQTYVKLDYAGGSDYAIVDGDAVHGTNTVITCKADRTNDYDNTKAYTNIRVMYGAGPLLDVYSFYNVFDGHAWDVWYEDSFVFRNGSAYNNLSQMGVDRQYRFIRDDATHIQNSASTQDYWQVGENYYGHVRSNPEFKEFRFYCDGNNVGGEASGNWNDALVIGRDIDMWNGIDGGLSSGLIKYNTNARIDVSNPITKIKNGLDVEGIILSATNSASSPPWYYFDGVGDKIQKTSASVGLTYPYTMYSNGIVGTTTVDQAVCSVSHDISTADYQSILIRGNNNFAIYRRATTDGQQTYECLGESVPDGEPYQVFVIFVSSTEAHLYLNGDVTIYTDLDDINIETTPTPKPLIDFHAGIGRSNAPNYYFNGYISNTALWDRALTSDEIALVMANPGFFPSSGLVAGWGHKKESGTWFDISSNANDGTVTSAVLKETY